MPQASEVGKEINLDLWGPSPVQMPGKKEHYASFMDNYNAVDSHGIASYEG